MKIIMYSVLAEEKPYIEAWEKKTGNQVTQIEDRLTPETFLRPLVFPTFQLLFQTLTLSAVPP